MAALLNEAVFREKLTKLSSTQQSIEQTSAWCQFHRTDARRVADVWEDFFSKADQPKRLALVYLANDIIQNGRRKGPEFLSEFYKVMPRALRHMMGRADEKTRTAVNKVIRVWDERKVFGSSGSKTFHELVHEAPSPAAAARPPMPAPAAAAAASGGNAGADYPAAGQLGEVLAAAAGAAAHSAQLAGAVAVAVPQALSGGSGAGGQQQVAAARQAVQGQLVALQAEMGSRQAAAAQLRQLLTEQEAGIAAAASRLQSCSHQLTQLDVRGSEMHAAVPAGPTQQQQQQQQAQQAMPAAAPMWGAPSSAQQQAVHMQEEAQYDLYAAPPLQQNDEPSQQAHQQHAGDEAAGHAELADPASEAASLAAALAQNQNSAEALLAALMKLPQEQQDGLGAELAGLLQPGAPAGGEANGGGEMGEGDDLYDPTDF